jgi:hypothetical protein
MNVNVNNDILGIKNPFAKLLPETSNIDNDIIRAASPQKLHNLYKLGYLNGVLLDIEGVPWNFRKFAKYNFDFLKANQEDNQSIIFEDTTYYHAIRGSSKGVRVMGHQNYLKIDPKKAMSGAQSTGDCVSWAIRDALDRLRTNKIAGGAWEAYIERQATCGIYSGRGHTGQGADPVGLSAFAVKIGTILEIVYEIGGKKYDFTNYDNYVSWGMSRGRQGVPDDLLEKTKQYTAGGYKVVATTDALADLLANGGTAHCGSGIGVSSQGDPISRLQGSWAHDMSIVGFDDTSECHEKFGGRIWLWDQSWGNWNSVSNIPDWWKPWGQGMFALTDASTQRAVGQGGTCVFYDGKWFDAEPIENKII